MLLKLNIHIHDFDVLLVGYFSRRIQGKKTIGKSSGLALLTLNSNMRKPHHLHTPR